MFFFLKFILILLFSPCMPVVFAGGGGDPPPPPPPAPPPPPPTITLPFPSSSVVVTTPTATSTYNPSAQDLGQAYNTSSNQGSLGKGGIPGLPPAPTSPVLAVLPGTPTLVTTPAPPTPYLDSPQDANQSSANTQGNPGTGSSKPASAQSSPTILSKVVTKDVTASAIVIIDPQAGVAPTP